MVTPDDKTKFLAELEEIPIPSVACKRVGISKASIYRWKKDDPDFRKSMEEAIVIGRDNITDLGEGKLVSLMKDGNFRAIKYWLESNNKRYYRPRKPYSAPPSHRVIHTVDFTVNGKPADSNPINIQAELSKQSSAQATEASTADSVSDPDTSPEAPEAMETTRDTSD